ncbi:MAG: sulfate adenylyltransferase [Candidatus Micrarchaeia archaeon]
MVVIKPNGGNLTNKIIDERKVDKILKEATEYTKIYVEHDDILEMYNIASGVFSPLKGFMNEDDYSSVIKECRLVNGVIFPIPIILTIKNDEKIKIGENATLVDKKNNPVGLITISDKFKYDKNELSNKVFLTNDISHVGVKHYQEKNDIAIGGEITLINVPYKNEMFLNTDKTPKEIRKIISERGWKTCVGFQTRNVPHRAHEYLQKIALEMFDGLLIHPLVGKKKIGDFKPHAIIRGYQTLIKNYYNPDKVIFSTLTTLMRYAGPREALFHAIIRQNFGCTHFIVGRDHAGVGKYYGKYDAHKIFENFPDLEIIPLKLNGPRYCSKCESVTTEKTCPHSSQFIKEINGTEIRDCILNGRKIPKEIMRTEVSESLTKDDLIT